MQHLVIVVHHPTAILVRLGNTVLLTEVVFLGLAIRIEIRFLCLHGDADGVASVRGEAVGCGVVLLCIALAKTLLSH